MGYSWPGVSLLGASGRTGRFFTQLLFHDPISIYLACDLVFLELCVTWIVYYVSMIWHVSFSLYLNKPSAWLEASRTKVCVFSCWDKLRFRGERILSPVKLVLVNTLRTHCGPFVAKKIILRGTKAACWARPIEFTVTFCR